MKFLKRFFDGIQRDLRLFAFVLILLEIYRGLFIFFMSNFISAESGAAQIFSAMFAGLRLSLKTAGAVTLVSFVFVTIGGLSARLRLLIGFVASLIFSLLFMLRFPYFRAFQSTFGMEVVQGFHDDLWSIIVTMFQEYGVAWRFLVAVLLTLICIAALSRLLILKTYPLPELVGKLKVAGFSVGLIVAIFLFGLFVRFGGSFTYASGINWENAGVTTDDFLNECILDDAQALYRARAMAKRMAAGEISGVDQNKIADAALIIAVNKDIAEQNLAPYLLTLNGAYCILFAEVIVLGTFLAEATAKLKFYRSSSGTDTLTLNGINSTLSSVETIGAGVSSLTAIGGYSSPNMNNAIRTIEEVATDGND